MRVLSRVATAFLIASGASAWGAGLEADRIEAVAQYPVKAKAGLPARETVITTRQALRAADADLKRNAGAYTGPELKRRQEKALRDAVQRLVDQTLLLQAAQDSASQDPGLRVSEADLKAQVRYHRNRLGVPDDTRLAEILEMEGSSLEVLRERIRTEMTVQRYLDRVVKPSPPPSPGDLLRYYAEHVEEFSSPQEVQFRKIVLRKDRFASLEELDAALRELWSAVQAGADFAELARTRSDGSSAQDGGLLPYLPVSSLRVELQALVEAVPSGRTLAVVDMPESFDLVRVDGVRQGQPPASDAIQGILLERMRQEDLEQRRVRVVQLLRRKAYVWTAPPVVP